MQSWAFMHIREWLWVTAFVCLASPATGDPPALPSPARAGILRPVRTVGYPSSTDERASSAAWSAAIGLGTPVAVGGSFALISALTCHESTPNPDFSDERSWCTCGCSTLLFGVLGVAVGALAAVVIDARLIAPEPAAPDRAWNLSPSFDPRTRAAGFVLSGGLF